MAAAAAGVPRGWSSFLNARLAAPRGPRRFPDRMNSQPGPQVNRPRPFLPDRPHLLGLRDTSQNGSRTAFDHGRGVTRPGGTSAHPRHALCIVGAGLAGLNALFVAALYLPRGARVMLVDRRPGPGGMWCDTYGHVRLHQPHRMFTVGDMPWAGARPDGYLATGAEVRGHLADCLDRLRGHFALTERFGYACIDATEADEDGAPHARITLSPDAGGPEEVVEADRLILAEGWDVPAQNPLPLASGHVRSITPAELSATGADGDAPVLIVGGGKTGMDTAHWLLTRQPGCSVTLVNGSGTVFANRDLLFPQGAARWWRGTPVSRLSIDLTTRFDGTNAEALFAGFTRDYGLCPAGEAGQYFFSTLSEDEAATIRAGLDAVLPGHLADVVDGAAGPEAVLRDGSRHPLRPGTRVVNCTGHMLRHERPHAPYVSPGGAICRVTSRSAVYPLTGTAGYFLAHVFFLGRLRDLPFYELDLDALHARDRKLFFLACLSHAFLNMLLVMEAAPLSVFGRCGLDLNRWYPLHRRLWALARLGTGKRRLMARCRTALDRVRQDTGIRCGPLGQ